MKNKKKVNLDNNNNPNNNLNSSPEPKKSGWNFFNKMQALVYPESNAEQNQEYLMYTMKKLKKKSQHHLQEDDFVIEEEQQPLENVRQNTDNDEEEEENEEQQAQRRVRSYKDLMQDISNKKPLLMYDALYKEVKEIFICKEAGIKQFEEA